MDINEKLQMLLDKDEIRTVISQFARGLDRLDLDAMLSTFHDDAWEYHGTTDAPAQEFAKGAIDKQQFELLTSHLLGQSNIQIEGDSANVETYFWNQHLRDENAVMLPLDVPGPYLVYISGRYIDRFEKREGEWKIFTRKPLVDYLHICPLNDKGIDMNVFYRPKRSREDESYFN